MIRKHSKFQSITSFLVIVCSVFAVSTANAQVSSMSGEDFAQYGAEAAYWVVTVTCSDSSERKIQRKTDGNLWCGKDVSGYCREVKNEAAELICGESYSVAWRNQSASAAEEAAQAAQRQAEERRQRQLAEQRRAEQRIAAQEAQRREQQAAAAVAAGPSPEQLSIEEELITIEQEKIELRKQELELRRRAVEIQSLLDGEVGS